MTPDKDKVKELYAQLSGYPDLAIRKQITAKGEENFVNKFREDSEKGSELRSSLFDILNEDGFAPDDYNEWIGSIIPEMGYKAPEPPAQLGGVQMEEENLIAPRQGSIPLLPTEEMTGVVETPKKKERGVVGGLGFGGTGASDVGRAIAQEGKRLFKTLGEGLINAVATTFAEQSAFQAAQDLPDRKIDPIALSKEIKEDADQRMFKRGKEIDAEFQKNITKFGVETNAAKAIMEGRWKDVPESVAFVVGSGAMQLIPAMMTYGTSTFLQTLPDAYVAGVEAKAQSLGITPEEVIQKNLDGKEIAYVSAAIQGLAERAGAGMVSKAIAQKGAYKAVKDGIIKLTGKKSWSNAAGTAGALAFTAGGEGLTGAAQEATGIGQEAIMGADIKGGEAMTRVLEGGINEMIGGLGVVAAGRGVKKIVEGGETQEAGQPTQPTQQEEVTGDGSTRRVVVDSIEQVPAEYRDSAVEVTTGPPILGRMGIGTKKQYAYNVPVETIEVGEVAAPSRPDPTTASQEEVEAALEADIAGDVDPESLRGIAPDAYVDELARNVQGLREVFANEEATTTAEELENILAQPDVTIETIEGLAQEIENADLTTEEKAGMLQMLNQKFIQLQNESQPAPQTVVSADVVADGGTAVAETDIVAGANENVPARQVDTSDVVVDDSVSGTGDVVVAEEGDATTPITKEQTDAKARIDEFVNGLETVNPQLHKVALQDPIAALDDLIDFHKGNLKGTNPTTKAYAEKAIAKFEALKKDFQLANSPAQLGQEVGQGVQVEPTPAPAKPKAEPAKTTESKAKSSWESNIEALINPESGMAATIRKMDIGQKEKDAFLERIGLTKEGYNKLDAEGKQKIQDQWVKSKEFESLLSKEPTPSGTKTAQQTAQQPEPAKSGKKQRKPARELPKLTPQQEVEGAQIADRYLAEVGNPTNLNPQELAIYEAMNNQGTSVKDIGQIQRAIGKKVAGDDFGRIRGWVNPSGTMKLDVVADEAGVSVDDVIDFMMKFGSFDGVTSPSRNAKLKELGDAYYNKTGRVINRRTAGQAIARVKKMGVDLTKEQLKKRAAFDFRDLRSWEDVQNAYEEGLIDEIDFKQLEYDYGQAEEEIFNYVDPQGGEQLNYEPVQSVGMDEQIEGLEQQYRSDAESSKQAAKELSSRSDLTHTKGVGMSGGLEGTFVSTDPSNRYQGRGQLNKATVKIKNPFVLKAGKFFYEFAEDLFYTLEAPFIENLQDLEDAGIVTKNTIERFTVGYLQSKGYDSFYQEGNDFIEGELYVFDRGNVELTPVVNVDSAALAAEVLKAEQAVKATKEAYDKKSKELGVQIKDDQRDIFGKKSTPETMFGEADDIKQSEAVNILRPLKLAYETAKENLRQLREIEKSAVEGQIKMEDIKARIADIEKSFGQMNDFTTAVAMATEWAYLNIMVYGQKAAKAARRQLIKLLEQSGFAAKSAAEIAVDAFNKAQKAMKQGAIKWLDGAIKELEDFQKGGNLQAGMDFGTSKLWVSGLKALRNAINAGADLDTELSKMESKMAAAKVSEKITKGYIDAFREALLKATPTAQEQVKGKPNPALQSIEATAKALEKIGNEKLKLGENEDTPTALNVDYGSITWAQSNLSSFNKASNGKTYITDKDGKIYEIQKTKISANNTFLVVIKDTNGNEVGNFEFKKQPDGTFSAEEAYVSKKGKGLAAIAYDYASQDGVTIKPSKKLKQDGIKFWSKSIATAYHAAKADGSNPELVKAVEDLLSKAPTTEQVVRKAEKATKELRDKIINDAKVAVQAARDATEKAVARTKAFNDYLKGLEGIKAITPQQAKKIFKQFAAAAQSEKGLNRAIEFATKVAEQADYEQNLTSAKRELKRLKKGSPRFSPVDNSLVAQIPYMDLTALDSDQLAELAQAMKEFRQSRVSGNATPAAPLKALFEKYKSEPEVDEAVESGEAMEKPDKKAPIIQAIKDTMSTFDLSEETEATKKALEGLAKADLSLLKFDDLVRLSNAIAAYQETGVLGVANEILQEAIARSEIAGLGKTYAQLVPWWQKIKTIRGLIATQKGNAKAASMTRYAKAFQTIEANAAKIRATIIGAWERNIGRVTKQHEQQRLDVDRKFNDIKITPQDEYTLGAYAFLVEESGDKQTFDVKLKALVGGFNFSLNQIAQNEKALGSKRNDATRYTVEESVKALERLGLVEVTYDGKGNVLKVSAIENATPNTASVSENVKKAWEYGRALLEEKLPAYKEAMALNFGRLITPMPNYWGREWNSLEPKVPKEILEEDSFGMTFQFGGQGKEVAQRNVGRTELATTGGFYNLNGKTTLLNALWDVALTTEMSSGYIRAAKIMNSAWGINSFIANAPERNAFRAYVVSRVTGNIDSPQTSNDTREGISTNKIFSSSTKAVIGNAGQILKQLPSMIMSFVTNPKASIKANAIMSKFMGEWAKMKAGKAYDKDFMEAVIKFRESTNYPFRDHLGYLEMQRELEGKTTAERQGSKLVNAVDVSTAGTVINTMDKIITLSALLQGYIAETGNSDIVKAAKEGFSDAGLSAGENLAEAVNSVSDKSAMATELKEWSNIQRFLQSMIYHSSIIFWENLKVASNRSYTATQRREARAEAAGFMVMSASFAFMSELAFVAAKEGTKAAGNALGQLLNDEDWFIENPDEDDEKRKKEARTWRRLLNAINDIFFGMKGAITGEIVRGVEELLFEASKKISKQEDSDSYEPPIKDIWNDPRQRIFYTEVPMGAFGILYNMFEGVAKGDHINWWLLSMKVAALKYGLGTPYMVLSQAENLARVKMTSELSELKKENPDEFARWVKETRKAGIKDADLGKLIFKIGNKKYQLTAEQGVKFMKFYDQKVKDLVETYIEVKGVSNTPLQRLEKYNEAKGEKMPKRKAFEAVKEAANKYAQGKILSETILAQ